MPEKGNNETWDEMKSEVLGEEGNTYRLGYRKSFHRRSFFQLLVFMMGSGVACSLPFCSYRSVEVETAATTDS